MAKTPRSLLLSASWELFSSSKVSFGCCVSLQVDTTFVSLNASMQDLDAFAQDCVSRLRSTACLQL